MAQNPFRLLELLQQAFGKSFVNKTIGTGTNVVKPTKFDINAPTKGAFSEDSFRDGNKLLLIEDKLVEYAPSVIANPNSAETANYIFNLERYINAKKIQGGVTEQAKSIKKPKTEGEVISIKTGKKVDDEGIMKLKQKAGIPEGIDPNSPQGKLIQRLNKLDEGSEEAESLASQVMENMFGFKAKDTMREGQRRAVVRQIMLKDKRISLPDKEFDDLLYSRDLQPGTDAQDPLILFDKYYDRNDSKFNALDGIIDGSRSTDEAADEFLKEFDGFDLKEKKPIVRQSLDDEATEIAEREAFEDTPVTSEDSSVTRQSLDDEAVEIAEKEAFDDPEDLAEGGRPGKGLDYLMGV